jgi:predicted ATPase
MYIEKLTIKGLRCFAEAKMDFNWPDATDQPGRDGLRLPNVNLLIGNNGTGKTTIFQALTIVALRSYLADNTSGFRTPMAIRHNTTFGKAIGSVLLSVLDAAGDTERNVSRAVRQIAEHF